MKYDLSRGITIGLPTNTGRNVIWKTRGEQEGKIYIKLNFVSRSGSSSAKENSCDILSPLCFLRYLSLVEASRKCQALNIAVNTPIQGIDPDRNLRFMRGEANFTKILRSEERFTIF